MTQPLDLPRLLAEHRQRSIKADLELLVFFAPAEGSAAADPRNT
jgi:hypothetical protein